MLTIMLQLTLGTIVYELPPDATHAAHPGPGLAPRVVVEMQVEALSRNDQPHADAGVEVAARFASPAFLEGLGGQSGLRAAFHADAFSPLLEGQETIVEPQPGDDRSTSVLVITREPSGRPVGFLFRLSRRAEGPRPNCWLVDGISRLGLRKRRRAQLPPRMRI